MNQLPEFVLNELSQIEVGGQRGYAHYLYGKVASGKTRYVQDLLNSTPHRVVVFDYENEYRGRRVNVGLPRSMVNVELVQALLRTEAQYTHYLVPRLRGESFDLNGLSKTQSDAFNRAIDKLSPLFNGQDIIKVLNLESRIRITPHPDYSHFQLVLLITSLIRRSNEIHRDRFGTIVVLEETEGLERHDVNSMVPNLIFQGRKRGIVFLLVGHRSPYALRGSAWGRDILQNMFSVHELKGGVLHRRG